MAQTTFGNIVKAILSEFYLDMRSIRLAPILSIGDIPITDDNDLVAFEYGRFRIFYNELDNIIYAVMI